MMGVSEIRGEVGTDITLGSFLCGVVVCSRANSL
jgi:hypothetical protein